MPANRTETGRFQKGKSGNPSGRPKTDERVTEALKAASVEAAQTLIDIMRNPDENSKNRLAAANSILDRVCGKAPQHIDADIDSTVKVVMDEAAARLAK